MQQETSRCQEVPLWPNYLHQLDDEEEVVGILKTNLNRWDGGEGDLLPYIQDL